MTARRLVEMRAALDASLIAHGQTADESEGEEEDAAANSARRELNNKKTLRQARQQKQNQSVLSSSRHGTVHLAIVHLRAEVNPPNDGPCNSSSCALLFLTSS